MGILFFLKKALLLSVKSSDLERSWLFSEIHCWITQPVGTKLLAQLNFFKMLSDESFVHLCRLLVKNIVNYKSENLLESTSNSCAMSLNACHQLVDTTVLSSVEIQT